MLRTRTCINKGTRLEVEFPGLIPGLELYRRIAIWQGGIGNGTIPNILLLSWRMEREWNYFGLRKSVEKESLVSCARSKWTEKNVPGLVSPCLVSLRSCLCQPNDQQIISEQHDVHEEHHLSSNGFFHLVVPTDRSQIRFEDWGLRIQR